MKFEVKKAENCFSDAENYEYRIEVVGSDLMESLKPQTEHLRVNDKLRRPTFTAALNNGVQLKGLMGKNVIKVGYVITQATEQKAAFEQWLTSL